MAVNNRNYRNYIIKAFSAVISLEDIVFDNKTSPLELFEDFFENRGGRQLTSEEKDFMQNLIEKICGFLRKKSIYVDFSYLCNFIETSKF